MPDFAQSISSRYRITGELGAGAMGVVYRAIQLDLGRPVAIKVLSEDVALEPVYLKRLKREARALSVLNHPGIVSVFDFDTTTADRPFLVMELVPGRAFKDLLKERRPSLASTLNLMQQAARALHHAHEKGIVHRDIKPANLLIDEERMELKIVDFGIARPASNMTQEQLTIQGEVFGSPLYMSPEQCSGKELDARSDIYSLGCVLFECIASRPPFRGESAFETMTMHLNAPPPVLKDEFDLGLFKDLSDIAAIALSKKPESRYQEMSQMAGDLDLLDSKVKQALQKQEQEKAREQQEIELIKLAPPAPVAVKPEPSFLNKKSCTTGCTSSICFSPGWICYYMGTQAKTEAVLEDVNPTAAGEEPKSSKTSIGLSTQPPVKNDDASAAQNGTATGSETSPYAGSDTAAEAPSATTVTDDDKRNQSQQSLNPDEANETKIDIPPGKGSQEPQTEQVEFDIKGAPDSGSKQTTSPDSQ
ncbi:MAG: serine/threonine protein kinase [Candidatus Obscuribacter sp.]|nr:serine/threonine protein kinase [Candidatus Obscuribacter sp.]